MISIRAKIMGAFIVVFLIPVTAMMFLFSTRMPESYDTLARERVFSALDGIRNDFDKLRLDTETRVESVAVDDTVVKDIWKVSMYTRSGDTDFIKRLSTIRRATGLDILRVVNDKKRLVADGANQSAFGNSYDKDPYVEEVLRKGQSRLIFKKITDGDKEKVTILVYQPVWYQSSPIAVLIGGNIIDEGYIRQLENLTTAKVVLFVDDNAVLNSGESKLSESLPINDEFLKKLQAEPGKVFQAGKGKNDFLIGGIPVKDSQTDTLFGFFALGVRRDVVKEIMSSTRTDMFYIAAVGIAISLVLALFISISITKPISNLVQFARRIGRGDFSEQYTDVKSMDEVGLLADTMNRMVKDLGEYSQKLAYSERMAAWSEIARRMAHEIKNPLSPIQLSMENLKAAYTDDRKSFDKFFPECADTVLEEVEKLRKLANEFSEFARLPKPIFEDIEIAELLKNLVAFHANTAPKNIGVELYADEAPIVIRADRDQLNRVFTNLIKNAIEAMPDGGILTVSARRRHGEIFIVFEDQGAGISKENMEKLFTPYYTTKEGGTGLGLSIVKKIMRDHDATIDVVSEEGQGTMFTMVFKELTSVTGGESNYE